MPVLHHMHKDIQDTYTHTVAIVVNFFTKWPRLDFSKVKELIHSHNAVKLTPSEARITIPHTLIIA